MNGRTAGEGGHGDRRFNTFKRTGLAVLFGVLIIALVGVFVVLPRWASSRSSAAGPQAPVAVTAGPTTPVERREPRPAAAAPVPQPSPPSRPTSPPPERRGSSPRAAPPAAPQDEAEFTAAMSRGLTALEDGHWQAAREHFEAAASLRPGAPEVADGLARTAAAERLALVGDGIRRGQTLEASESWAEAERVYAAVLSVDPEAAGALEGHERTAHRASLDEKLEYHLQNPKRLSYPSVFEDAADVLAEARELDPHGPRLQKQISGLEKILEVASTPVPVVVVSDNLTDVVIYRFDRLGVFSRRELELPPGTYTAVGSRIGYRDVRVRFDVNPGGPPQPVTVVCTEQL